MHLSSMPLVGEARREIRPWVEAFARVGFVAKGVLYMTIGGLAAAAALGMGGKADPDSRTALQQLFEAPFGRVLVGVIALGLLGYAAWRVLEGVANPQGKTGVKGAAYRVGAVARGAIHLVLAGAAASLAVWREGSGGGGGRTREYVGKGLALPGGSYVLWAIAAGLLGYGVYQLYKAYRAKLSRELRLGAVRGRGAIIAISRFGIAARGVVFVTVAVLLGRAVRDHDARQAGGIGDSLRALFTQLGRGPYLAIALGLAAYGVYQLINAKYRRIQV
jgi:high-affinity Fe2+/Pb2+ permease